MRRNQPSDNLKLGGKTFWDAQIANHCFPNRDFETLRVWFKVHIMGKTMAEILENSKDLPFCHEFLTLQQVDLSDISADILQKL